MRAEIAKAYLYLMRHRATYRASAHRIGMAEIMLPPMGYGRQVNAAERDPDHRSATPKETPMLRFPQSVSVPGNTSR
jgi:hypothetical protein